MPTLFDSGKPKVKDNPLSKKSISSKTGPLTYFSVNPSGLRFETQQDDETVILFLRQHLIVNVPWILLTLLLLLAPIVLFPLLLQAIAPFILLSGGYAVVMLLGWYLVTFGFAFASFLRWFFNIYIVTNERVVDIDFIHLLYKQFSEAQLLNIQDITFKTGGVVETMFNFGSVYIQTASEVPNFEFISVPNPEQIVKIISQAAESAKKQGHGL